jgi:hypothetical protein
LCAAGTLEDLFGHPMMYPTILLPAWFDESCEAGADEDWHAAIAYSSACGYLQIRLTDNAMDGPQAGELRHLPLATVLHTEFQHVYAERFDAAHAFWEHFTTIWCRAAEATAKDACSKAIDDASYLTTAARKTLASRIPLVAAALRRGEMDRFDAWNRFLDDFDAWAQRVNDMLDWHRDLRAGRHTLLLDRARTAAPTESVTSWLLREGVEQEAEALVAMIAGVHRTAEPLESPGLSAYLALRAEDLRIKADGIAVSLRALRDLVAGAPQDTAERLFNGV